MKILNTEVAGFSKVGRMSTSSGAYMFLQDAGEWGLEIGEACLMSAKKFASYGATYNSGQGWDKKTVANGPIVIMKRKEIYKDKYIQEKGIANAELAGQLSEDEGLDVSAGDLVFKIVRVS